MWAVDKKPKPGKKTEKPQAPSGRKARGASLEGHGRAAMG